MDNPLIENCRLMPNRKGREVIAALYFPNASKSSVSDVMDDGVMGAGAVAKRRRV